MKQWAKQKQSGFTIVELLIVVVVVAILAAITIVSYGAIRERADTSALHTNATQAYKKVESHKTLNGSYPANLDAVGIVDANGVDFDMRTFNYGSCVSVVKASAVYHVSTDNGSPTFGGCGQVKAEYYNNTTFAGTPAAVTYVDSMTNIWGTGSPLDGKVNNDSFTSRFTSYIIPPVSGDYVFYTLTDDIEKVVINGTTLIDGFTTPAGCCTLRTLPAITLTANVPVPVVYEHREGGGGAYAQLQWTHPSQTTRVAVPASVFSRVAY